MQIHITPSRHIYEIQQDFSSLFPFLKLEFFVNRHSKTHLSAAEIAPGGKKIGDIQRSLTDGLLSLDQLMKVMDLEHTLNKDFSLASQVFRKSGNVWLETTMTDGWTLQQQNNHGREISMTKNSINTDEYDLNRDANH
jgi:hypothetical protein